MYRTQFTINWKDREEAKAKKDQAIRTVQRRLTKQLYYPPLRDLIPLFVSLSGFLVPVSLVLKAYMVDI